MALGKYSRVDGRRSSSNYCSTVTIVVFVALCLVGVWMMTSSSVVPAQNVDVPSGDNKNEVKEQAGEINENKPKQFEDNPGDLPKDATQSDSSRTSAQSQTQSNDQENPDNSDTFAATQESQEEKPAEKSVDEENKSEDASKIKRENVDIETKDTESKFKDGESNTEDGETKLGDGETQSGGQAESREGAGQKKSDESEQKSNSDENEKKLGDKTQSGDEADNQREKGQQNKDNELEQRSGEKKENGQAKEQVQNDVFPSGAQSELLNETTIQNGSWSTQAAESKNEKEAQKSSDSEQQPGYSWKICNVTAGSDYIPCLDNIQAIKHLRTTKHYEHRERHCPEPAPACLVRLPEGYRRSIEWPKSRDKIWYYNVPHTKLAEFKGHQNWVKVTGEYLTFPGGGTQFKNGALHYIEFIEKTVPDISWGKRSRVVLDVGCGVASFGGFLFEKDVLTMSFAPKDEHEAQVQFALERGIPAVSAVMGTKRLPFPGRVFDVVHCARCRVPWHIEGGKLLLELNRVLRPGGFFVWSATPVYQKLSEDVEIWNAMRELTNSMCWELVAIKKDKLNEVGAAIYRKTASNDCYEKRQQNEPPLCQESDDPNAAWNVPLQVCMHKVPVDASERGSVWPEQWPARLEKVPYWLKSSQLGVYGKAAPEDFISDYKHWKRVVTKSYLTGMGISWSSVRNVMDMRSVYGGFAAALRDMKVWVMNVVTVDSPDTLPIIYERGLFGIYHDWCESFSTYPRSYDLLHADHLFSKVKKKCNLVAVVAEVDRILRPGGKLIVRDEVETIKELENLVRPMQWEIRLTYSKYKEGLLCVEKSMWRPKEAEQIISAIA
ncbi:probable methyltransferase PMT26 [Malania oleifera]|uniref:probable methyltransferase PMT26 n=1 Tax=Malania oleifera TaxID=397392 RepID=UPI0025AE934E|nr:probable methyltransferase PMT26 [Malania oleifera]XP_057966068.1 probable methyltransferase PMT26 [Malania oleifera]XP_057966086.1 probable methyltransferase PMT26 [Malania oleifera]XP_057966096.1 probable methyltransferase PMT26 [Malania oleifera]XP_057966104.1 probable methyltransferase PMT26 [Malania oleifera]